jgi:hypothetical protein
VEEGNIIETLNDHPLHLIDCCCVPCNMEIELHHPPILFDKVEFTMIFRIEVTQMTTRLDQLLKLGLLRDEIGL